MVKYLLIVFLSVVTLGLQAQTFQAPARLVGTPEYRFVELDITPTCVQIRITEPEDYQKEHFGDFIEIPVVTIKEESSYMVIADELTLRYEADWFTLYFNGNQYVYGRPE